MSYCYFVDKRSKLQPDICNGCHDVLVMSMKLSNIAILNNHQAGCHCIIGGISKSEAIPILLKKAEHSK